jgi:hypothetical protein
MSTTFSPAPLSCYVMECAGCGTQSVQQFSTAEQVHRLCNSLVVSRGRDAVACPVCGGHADGMFCAAARVPGHAEVNLAFGNAAMIGDLLGLSDLSGGSMSAQDFLGRVLLALALSPADEGMPLHAAVAAEVEALPVPLPDTGVEVFIGARPEGYVQDTLEELRSMAQVAADAGVGVVWQ